MRAQTHLDVEADARGFLVAYVDAASFIGGFNAGDCCGSTSIIGTVNDVGVAKSVVTAISADYCVDPKHVYAAGFSNGGFLSYRIACEAADTFAAVASVAGVLGIAPEKCKPSRPVPILHVHGTADLVVSFKGGLFRSVDATLTNFRTLWGCESTSTVTSEQGAAKCERWSGCEASAALELCTIDKGGHQWPGGKATAIGGKMSMDLDASKRVMDFLEGHALP
jgi:polyhydroxybutyrate depolymerase